MFFLKYAFENFVLKVIHLESLESKSHFFLKYYATIFFGFTSYSVFNKKIRFWVRHESKLMVPNKWDNCRLDLYISIGELVKPLHKIIFSKLIFAATLAIYWNHIYLFFRNYIQDVCDNWWFRILWLFLLC